MIDDIDLDRLGDVWRQQPDPAEMARLRKTAAIVSRRARWGQLFDVVAAVAVAAVVIYLALSNPSRGTLGVSAILILILLWTQQRQRRLRAIEIKKLTGTSEEMLDQSLEQAEAVLKRTRSQLLFSPPAFVFGLALAALADRESADRLWEHISSIGSGQPIAVIALAWLPAFILYSLMKIRSQRRQVERLAALRDAYRAERDANIEDLPQADV